MRREKFDNFNLLPDGMIGLESWRTTVYFGNTSYEPFINACLIGDQGSMIAAYHGVYCITADDHLFLNGVELMEFWGEMPTDLRTVIENAIAICAKFKSEDEIESSIGTPCAKGGSDEPV